ARSLRFRGEADRLGVPHAEPRNGLRHESDRARRVTDATILVVDDEPAMRDLLDEALTAFGYRVLVASSAEEALDLALATPPDLVLSDVHMSGLSGVELCARLKAHPRFRLTPVVLLTAVSDLEARVAG